MSYNKLVIKAFYKVIRPRLAILLAFNDIIFCG
jgi:hypothetical protein